MKNIRECVEKTYGSYPEKVLQFGEGNFLRAFADWMIDLANESGAYHGSVVVCQPVGRRPATNLLSQGCVYTVAMRGLENGELVEKFRPITSVSRCLNPMQDYDELMKLAESNQLEVIISNTTEAGIAYHEGDRLEDRPQTSYPGKLCAFLYRRYAAFHGAADKGLLILPAELIDDNGTKLLEIVERYAREWGLEEDFLRWLETSNAFCNTLVDRIVTGYPKDSIEEFDQKLGYHDEALVACEPFNLWVIEGSDVWKEKFPLHRTEANVLWTKDVRPYKKRKVRILNGSHSAVVSLAYLAGYDTVLSFFKDSLLGDFERQLIAREIIPVVDLPKEELTSFADAVMERYCNPFIRHYLLDITLNQSSKFRARCLPTMREYQQINGKPAPYFSLSLAGMLRFFRIQEENGAWYGTRENGERYQVRDDEAVLRFFAELWQKDDLQQVVHEALSSPLLWGDEAPATLDSMEETVRNDLQMILNDGISAAVKKVMGK